MGSGLIGAGIFLGLFVFSLLFHGGFSILGVQDERMKIITDVLSKTFPAQIGLFTAWLLLLHLAVGFALGIWAALLTRSRGARVAVILILHGLFYARQIVVTPQLYAEFWLMRGGIREAVQAALTDGLNPLVPTVILALLGAAALVRAVLPLQKRPASALAAGACLLASVFLITAAAKGPAPARGGARPNVLMIGVDSLRSDRLSAAGYARDTTPSLDALAARGALFEQCYTPLPRTFPAWVSILTGETPPVHGVRSMFPTYENRAFLPPTVVEALRDTGYRTAVVSDFAGDIFPRIDLGFEDIHAPPFTVLTLAQLRLAELMTHLFPYVNNRPGRRLLPILWEFAQNADPGVLTDEAVAVLDDLADDDSPFLLAVFYSTTHFPFGAPYPYYGRYADPDYDGPHRYHKYTLLGQKETVTEADKVQVNALYDGALRAVDDQVGRLLDRLDRAGLAENTLVLVFGDHGEDLYEMPDTPVAHGEQLRSEASLKSPLILSGPGIPGGRRFGQRVRLIDIAPTLAGLCGVCLPKTEGMNLAPVLGGIEIEDRPVFVETGLWFDNKSEGFVQDLRLPYPDVTRIMEIDPLIDHEIVIQGQWEQLTNLAKHRAWIHDGWKLVRMPMVDGIHFELYDLESDPACSHDLSAERPDQLLRLSGGLNVYVAGVDR